MKHLFHSEITTTLKSESGYMDLKTYIEKDPDENYEAFRKHCMSNDLQTYRSVYKRMLSMFPDNALEILSGAQYPGLLARTKEDLEKYDDEIQALLKDNMNLYVTFYSNLLE